MGMTHRRAALGDAREATKMRRSRHDVAATGLVRLLLLSSILYGRRSTEAAVTAAGLPPTRLHTSTSSTSSSTNTRLTDSISGRAASLLRFRATSRREALQKSHRPASESLSGVGFAAVTKTPVHGPSKLPIIPVEYGITNAKLPPPPAVSDVNASTPEYSADEAILRIRVSAVRKRIHIALTEVYLRVKAAREDMLLAVQVATGGGKWADNTLRAITDARVNTNKAVGMVEQANAIVTQLNENTQDSNTLIGGLLQVHELVLQGWKWISMGALDCHDGAKFAEDESLHSGTLIQRAQIKASEHLVSANKHLKGAANSCWGSLGDEEAKKAMTLDRAKLKADFSMSSNTRNISDTVLHSIAEQKLLPFSAGAGSLQGTDRSLRRIVRYQERELSWTPCFQDLCKSLGAVERSGCTWGCFGLLSIDHSGFGADNFAGFCAAHAKGVLSHTADEDLFQVVKAAGKDMHSSGGSNSMLKLESIWAKACRDTCLKRKASPSGWGAHGGVLDGSKPQSITVEEEIDDGEKAKTGGGLERASRNTSATLSQANLRAGDRWAVKPLAGPSHRNMLGAAMNARLVKSESFRSHRKKPLLTINELTHSMSAGFTPHKKYSRHGTTLPQGYAAGSEAKAAAATPVLDAPTLDDTVKPKVLAKARWADLKSRVVQRSSVKAQLRRQSLRSKDIWARIGDNEKMRIQLGKDESSDEDDDEDGESFGVEKRRRAMHVWVHIHDNTYPESLNDHLTRFAINKPSQTFSFPIGKGDQDFRWLALGCMRRFTSVYRPRGRIRHREWFIGPGDVNLRAQQIYVEKGSKTLSQAQEEANKLLQETLKKRKLLAEQHGISMVSSGAFGVVANATAGSGRSAVRAKKEQESLRAKAMRAMTENTKLNRILKDGDHVWIQFQNGTTSALLAGGLETDMSCVDMFRRTRMTDGIAIAHKPKSIKIKEVVADKKTFTLETSVFASRAKHADSGSFYDTKEYYDRVCKADLAYCPRILKLVGGMTAYNRVSNAGKFEMSWLDFSAFAKYCKLVESHGEHKFGVGDLDNIWVVVNCHNNNEMVDSHHVRFLSRFEFLEALVRIALAKYSKRGVTGAYAAIEHLLNAHIVPHFKHMDANVFRRVKLYSESTARTFEQFKPSLRLAFKTFAETCRIGQHRDKLKLSLTKEEWVDMLNSAGVLQETGLTRKTAFGIFIFSQNSVIDEFRRSRKDTIRDNHKTMSFEEMLEGIARAADVWTNGDMPFDTKLTRFLGAFCRGLRL
eukprot:g942.t1